MNSLEFFLHIEKNFFFKGYCLYIYSDYFLLGFHKMNLERCVIYIY